MVTIEGKYGIKATILADSISKGGVRFITYEIEYPRLVLAELNTHKMLSKNSFSSRAVPFNKMVQQLNGRPVRFGANQGGMQDKGEDYSEPVLIPDFLFPAFSEYLDAYHPYCDIRDLIDATNNTLTVNAETAWEFHKFLSVEVAGAFNDAKYHKQIVNRLTEAHQMMKTVISGTEVENFFWLRDHEAADPSLHELARVMNEAREASKPELLEAGEWHLPYVDYWQEQIGYAEGSDDTPIYGQRQYHIGDVLGDDYELLTLEQAIKVSCARCAAVSYRNEGYNLAKSLEVFDRLLGDERKHASAFEHCATPVRVRDVRMGSMDRVNTSIFPATWEPGITHMDREGNLWSGNLKGFIQYRKLIPGENYTG